MFFFIIPKYRLRGFDFYHNQKHPIKKKQTLTDLLNSAKGTRTLVTGVRGQCPGPLDDGTEFRHIQRVFKASPNIAKP